MARYDDRDDAILGVHIPALALAASLIGFGSSAVLPLPSLFAGGLRIACIALALIGVGGMLWFALHALRSRISESMARPLVEGALTPAFLSNAQGQTLFRNIEARTTFRGASITDAVGDLSAAPDILLQRLCTEASNAGCVREEIATRQGVVCIAVSRLSPGLLFWQIEPKGEFGAPDGNIITIPMLILTRTGAISYCNPAAIDLIGGRPAHISDLFGGREIHTGQTIQLTTETGGKTVLVYASPASAAQRQIFLLPDLDLRVGSSEESDWDLVEDLPVPLLKIALGGEILSANRGARELLRSDLPPGTRLADLLDGLGRPFADWLKEAYRNPGASQPQFLRGAGENRARVVQVALRKSRSGEVPHLIGVLHNATEFKQLEAQFVQSQKMQAIGQLAGGVAHDFNNLLTAIAGHCDLMLMRHDEHDTDYPDLTQIRQNTDRAAALVGQLLAFSRKQDLQLEPLDLRDTLADLTHLLNRLVGERVDLTLVHDPAPLNVLADKSQLEQVIVNLVVNARDAMDGAGAVRIEAETTHLASPLVRDRATVHPGDYVVIRVVDQGCGIPPEMASHVFEPFYTTKGIGEGTGLGLSTAYGIVKQLGGFIFLDSVLDEGTTFSVFLPVHEEQSEAEASLPPQAQAQRSDGGGVVLLVEDEAPVRAFAARALKLQGYEVIEADSGEAALQKIAETASSIDLFVTDVVMPGLDGPSWVREALKARPDAKVIFVSGYSEDALRENRADIPNSVFLPKPFALADLVATVDAQMTASETA